MTDERIISYLLKELPPNEMEQFEDDCFAEEEWPAQIELVEEDLVDAYLRNELPVERRQLFENNYLTSPARRERLALSAALLRLVDENQPSAVRNVEVSSARPTWADRFRAYWNSQGSALRIAVVSAAIVLVAGIVWVSLSRRTATRTFATTTLTISRDSNRAMGAQAGRVKMPINADALRIALALPQPSVPGANYRVELEDEDGNKRQPDLISKDAQSVVVEIPAKEVKPGRYAFHLFMTQGGGAEQRISGSYFLTVE